MPPLAAHQMPGLAFEQGYWDAGHRAVAGLDEVGRGALAGPVAAAAVILHPLADHSLLLDAGVRDSKKISPARRVALRDLIRSQAQGWAVGFVPAGEIDRLGIAAATRQAMILALQQLPVPPSALLVDYLRLREADLPQQAIVHGDCLSLSIAAASIVAKVARDQLLSGYEEEFPGYGFSRNKGYGTAAHLAALATLGPCRLHRLTFQPVREVFRR